jgi:hypothetical protein
MAKHVFNTTKGVNIVIDFGYVAKSMYQSPVKGKIIFANKK